MPDITEAAGFTLIALGIVVLFALGMRRQKRTSPLKMEPPSGQEDSARAAEKETSELRRGWDFVRRFWFLFLIGGIVLNAWNQPPPTVAEREHQAAIDRQSRQNQERKRYLCQAAAACKKYDEVRLECATAGNFKTCLRIKMGNEASYSDTCSFTEGGPASPRPPETPNVGECFFLTLIR